MQPPRDDPPTPSRASARAWWVMPMVIGLVVTGLVLLLTDFYPDLTRFYSVF